jgi:YegS/Rv2252/BmrU family lipid kinase
MIMGKNALLLVNPLAGKGQIRSKLMEVVDLFTKAGWEVTVYPTQKTKDGMRFVEANAHRFDRIICAGGDGTLNETVNGLLNAGVSCPIGYIPAGTTNDFATTLGLPVSPVQAARHIINGLPQPCDIGRFNGRYFVYSAAFGAFSDVPYITPQRTKNILGHTAYILQGIERLSYLKPYHLVFEYNGKIIEDDFIFGMVSNSDYVGGFKGLAGMPVFIDDGEFEVILVKMPQNGAELQSIILALLRHDTSVPEMYAFRANKLVMRSETPVSWTLDGEFGGAVTEAEIEIFPHAISLLLEESEEKENRILSKKRN